MFATKWGRENILRCTEDLGVVQTEISEMLFIILLERKIHVEENWVVISD
jgi:hypothetical protein